MPHDKLGNYLSWKEYWTRFKTGVEGITPFQQARMSYRSTWIILLGIVLGIVFASMSLANLWWLLVILIGALGNTMVQQIGNYQRLSLLRRLQGES